MSIPKLLAQIEDPSLTPFERLVKLMAILRSPEGCNWDRKQTHESLIPYLVEESYEVIDAIEQKQYPALREELGDLAVQLVFHAQLAAERGEFTIHDALSDVVTKLVNRHPHVFGTVEAKTSGEVLKNWEQIKSEERNEKTVEKKASVIDGVPQALPALLRAQRLGEKASRVGFDWSSPAGVWEKIEEEIRELKVEVAKAKIDTAKPFTTAPKERSRETQLALESEIGDLLFSICQYSRWLGVSAEDGLRGTVERFTARFREMEGVAEKPMSEMSEDELEAAWQSAKKRLSGKV